MKKYIYILFFIFLAFSIGSSLYILNKKSHYKPRTLLLQNLRTNNFISSHIHKRIAEYEVLNRKFKLGGKKYEIIVQYTKDDIQVWVKTSNETCTNLHSFIEKHRIPINGSNSERFENFYESLCLSDFDYHIAPLNATIDYLAIFENCYYKSISGKTESPPPKMRF